MMKTDKRECKDTANWLTYETEHHRPTSVVEAPVPDELKRSFLVKTILMKVI